MIRCFILVLLLPTLIGCFSSGCLNEAVSRQTSQDKQVDVVISSSNCGATVSDSFRVHIVPAGSDDLGQYVFLADNVRGLKADWIGNQMLAVTYEQARIFEYQNFWESKELDNFRYKVFITEALRKH